MLRFKITEQGVCMCEGVQGEGVCVRVCRERVCGCVEVQDHRARCVCVRVCRVRVCVRVCRERVWVC